MIPNPPLKVNKKLIHFSLTLLAALGFGIGSGAVHTMNSFGSSAHNGEPQLIKTSLALADYHQLEVGDTLQEVQLVLGVGFEQKSSSSESIYIWTYSDDSLIQAVFRNGVLQSKEQSVLPPNVCIASSGQTRV